MPGMRWTTILCAAALLAPLAQSFGQTPQPPAPAPPPASESTQPPASAPASGKKKHNYADDFLIIGTVFNEKAMSFPGVRLRIRRAGEKKFHWESYTNSRGDFALRLPQGSNYEMVIHAKGFVDQVREIGAKNGGNEERMVFRMQLTTGGQK
jgi:hypothetical protein